MRCDTCVDDMLKGWVSPASDPLSRLDFTRRRIVRADSGFTEDEETQSGLAASVQIQDFNIRMFEYCGLSLSCLSHLF